MAISYTETRTYTIADVEAAFRRFRSDIFMIADSTGSITRSKADDYAHDAELLANRKYLRQVDVTLMCAGVELRATKYTVNEDGGGLQSSRPGGVLWPRVSGAVLRVILSYNATYTDAAREVIRSTLKVAWTPTSDDISHASLAGSGGRNYVSNGYGLQRTDFG